VKLTQRRLARPSLGGMLATRQGSLVLALLCAAAAAGVLMFALGRYKSNLRVATPQATVLVSTGEIQKGTSGQNVAADHLYRSTPVLASQVQPGAISDAGALAGETAQADILPGQQLTSADFAPVAGVASVLAPGDRAVSVAIDEAHGDGDVLLPGDDVDIYATVPVTRGTAVVQTMVLLVPDATVIKPASSVPVRSGGTTVTGSTLVLAVPAAQAAEIAFAADNAKLYLTLRPFDASRTPPTQISLDSIGADAAANDGVTSAAGNTTTNAGAKP